MMRSFRTRSFLTIVLFIRALSPDAAFGGTPSRHTGGAPAAAEPALHPDVQSSLTRSPGWRSFLSRHGAWNTSWNERTGTPQRSFGPAIAIPGYAETDDAGRVDLLLSFLRSESGALGIDPGLLRLRRFQKIGNVRFVSFVQTYRSVDVLFSEVEIRVHDRGAIMALGVVAYPDIDIPAAPRLTGAEASARVRDELGPGVDVSIAPGDGGVAILPMDAADIPRYRLVYRFAYMADDGARAGDIYVDALSGEVARVDDRVLSDGVSGSVTGRIQPVLPTDSQVTRPFGDLFIVAGPDTLYPDSTGFFSGTVLHADTMTVRLRGRWVYVSRADSASGKTVRPYGDGDTVDILWDDAISNLSERNVYYHASFAHDYLKSIDSTFTGMDYPLVAAVNLRSSACNAFWNGSSINFYQGDPGCVNAARSPATIYHEYAHAANDALYGQAGATKMFNKTAHEGTADLLACLIEDTPLFGRGFWGPGTVSRSLQNTKSYPADIVGQEHQDGLILAGAFWDLRVLTDLATVRRLSHMAKWGVPDDTKFGAACAEWFVETLVADDDDGDLGNGTPHFDLINDSFNAHGIGTLLFYTLSFIHTPYPATENTTHDYVLSFSMSGWGGSGDSAIVRYSTDAFRTTLTVPATEFTPGTFLALIPPQPAGTMVSYYVEALDTAGRSLVQFPRGAPVDDAYTFLVGPYTSALVDDLETPGGWTAGLPDDDATSGRWDWGQPQATFNGWRGVQPGGNHTPSGSICFVTGAAAGATFTDFDVDGGHTTLLSPVYDLTALENPVIRYYRWYSNNLGEDPRGESWRVDISGDGGATWTGVESTSAPSNFWKKIDVMVGTYVQRTDSVMLRFVASDEGTPTLVEALVDDFEILTMNGLVLPVEGGPPSEVPPGGYRLGRNYPNPFNGRTIIPYSLPEEAGVSLVVRDILGREVGRPVDGRRPAGDHEAAWEPGSLPSGIYYYTLSAGTFRRTGKLLYLR